MKLTIEQRADVVARALNGETYKAIADALGVSKRTVGRVIRASGVTVRHARSTEHVMRRRGASRLDWQRIAALNAEGLWLAEIGRRVGCNPSAARYVLQQMGLKQNYKRALSAQQYGEIMKSAHQVAEPQTVVSDNLDDMLCEKDASSVLGVSMSCLRTWRKRNQGPSFYKLAHRVVRYKRSDLVSFIESLKVLTQESK